MDYLYEAEKLFAEDHPMPAEEVQAAALIAVAVELRAIKSALHTLIKAVRDAR